MQPEGYWDTRRVSEKYFSSVWSLITLAQLGAHVQRRIGLACTYYLSQAHRTWSNHRRGTPSSTIDCRRKYVRSVARSGFEDARLKKCLIDGAQCDRGRAAPARTRLCAITPEGRADFRQVRTTPRLGCGKACWLSANPLEKRTPLMKQAIQRGVDFSSALIRLPIPCGYAAQPVVIVRFPVFYITDLTSWWRRRTWLREG